METDGWWFVVGFEEEEEDEDNEEMKSAIMARSDGLNLPYQMRLMEISPIRRGPLWYSKAKLVS